MIRCRHQHDIPMPDQNTAVISSVSARLAARVEAGSLTADPAQQSVAGALDRLLSNILTSDYRSILSRLAVRKKLQRGFYIHGGVGRGKTMLMDMFHDCLSSSKLQGGQFRLHFHDFMVLAQDTIHAARTADSDDPVEAAAATLAARGRVMCFDEMEVRDIADAMILARLFTGLFDKGVVVVATSNRHADELYKNGLHRDRFLPFIALLKQRCEMLTIADGRDWRAQMLAGMASWHVPDDRQAAAALDDVFARLASDSVVGSESIRVAGREISFDRVAGDVARISFANLCETPLGARDYLAIAGRFAGLLIDHVPVLTNANEPAARRFMWLVDALYDRQRFLVASAATDIANLYQGHNYSFEFERTGSRLGEMTHRGAHAEST